MKGSHDERAFGTLVAASRPEQGQRAARGGPPAGRRRPRSRGAGHGCPPLLPGRTPSRSLRAVVGDAGPRAPPRRRHLLALPARRRHRPPGDRRPRPGRTTGDHRRTPARARVRDPRPAHPPGHRRPLSRGTPAPEPAGQVLLPPARGRELGRRRPPAALAAGLAGAAPHRSAGAPGGPRGSHLHDAVPRRGTGRGGRPCPRPGPAPGQLRPDHLRADAGRAPGT
jgi:hypothetical protein